ncbi:MAG: winged helix-turn-helix domain-containing protein [Bryobacteraceae bacterium]
MKTRRLYRFGPFCLDATAKVLLKDGEPAHLARKAVETLLVLVENCGQVLTKEELMAAVWPDRVVDEANLAQNVAVIRKVLAAEHGEPGHIETFPGRGYRIVGPIAASDEVVEAPHPIAEEAAPHPQPVWLRPRYGLAALAVVAVLVALWAWRRSAAPPATEELHRVAVTRLGGREYQPVISPDGANVAFVWEQQDGRASAIMVKRPGERPPRQITPRSGSYSSPAWSPDGRHMAYIRFQGSSGTIILTTPDGKQEREVATVFPSRYGLPNRHLDWSPDSRFLVADDAESPHEALGLFLISLATGEKKRLTRPDNLYIGDVDPRFSPDGRTVSFIRVLHRAHQELFMLPADGGTPTQLTSDGRQVSGQDWMPDGKTLVFGSDRTGEFRLWKLSFAPGSKTALQPAAIYGDFPIQLSIARRTAALVYSVLQHDLNIWRLDLAPTASPDKKWTRIIASSGQDVSPQYAPDGSRICFRSDRSGEEQLWITDSDGGNPVQVTHGALRPSVGRWSPDGRAIVFNNARTGEIFVARSGAEGAWTTQKTSATGYHPVFSPDGQWIYAGTTDSIVRMPAQGGPVSEVVKTRGLSLGTSADGKYIYFVREPADSILWRAETSSGQVSKVVENLVPYCTSCWALTSSGVYYLGSKPDAPDRQTLYFHDLATRRTKPIVDYPEPLPPMGSGPFSLSRDGRYLLCVRVETPNADVFRVEPFR